MADQRLSLTDPLLSFLPQPLMSACQREWSLPDV